MKRLLLPKNKFVRVAINVIFILFWSLFFILYLYPWWGFIVVRPFFYFYRCGIISWDLLVLYCPYGIQTYDYGVFMDIIDWTSLVLPSLLLTKFIWFPKRPKIPRSKE